ncbi:MAG: DUF3108 domain-containing protein [Methylophilus sp.]|uniref:DUF3108 domain-containing protein n=1 Tax=Methylophilus sp. TaxID=29541 RepID=UPI003F9F7198
MINRQGLHKWIRQHVSWSLGLALFISLLVHMFVLKEAAWQSWFAEDAPPPTLLSAQLQVAPAKPVLKAPVKPDRQKKSPATTPEPSTPVTHSPQSVTEAPDVSQTIETSEEAAGKAEEARQAEIAAWHDTDNPVDEPEEALPPPYQRVSTEFSVYVNGEKQPAGSASIEYAQQPSGQYALRWVVEGRGLLKLLYTTLEQQSRGDIGPHGLKPHFYRYAFGNKTDKIYEANLDWETNSITLKTAKGEQRTDLPQNTQDILSFMYQFMFVPPLQEMQVALTNGRRLNTYQYAFEGEDTMVIADQTIHTVHIAHSRGETDEKIELWLASDYRYVPVKIRKQEKNGMVIEQVATRLITE